MANLASLGHSWHRPVVYAPAIVVFLVCHGDKGLIDRVAINPPDGTLDVGAEVPLRAEAWDEKGNYIRLEDHKPWITVDWNAIGEGGSSSDYRLSASNENPTSLSVTGDQVRAIRLVLTVTENFTNGTSPAVHTATSRFTFKEAKPEPTGDRVRAKLTLDNVVAMINACKVGLLDVFGPKQVDLTHRFVGWTEFEENLTERDCARPAEFAIFATQHRALLSFASAATGPATTPTWTDELGDELRTDMLEWKPPDEILLHLHFFIGNVPDAHTVARSRVAEANRIFQDARLGIQLVPVPWDPSSLSVKVTCDAPFFHNVLGIDTTIVQLNVVFATEVIVGSQQAGWTCGASPQGGGRFILIDYNRTGAETLAHEIGHVLSHEYPGIGYFSGHVGTSTHTDDGFTKTNLMHAPIAGIERSVLTIGQVFRMNVDTGSWYQHEPEIVPHPKKACGDSPNQNEPCPRLNRNPG